MTWQWLRQDVVVAIHDEQIAEHGGHPGIRDAGLLLSALARPKNKMVYQTPSVFDLAAAYASSIILNHPFVDGNKRTGFLAAYLFLYLNGWNLTVPEAEAVGAVLALAVKEMDEVNFSNWLEDHSIRIPGQDKNSR
jgi:death-on-curing protein